MPKQKVVVDTNALIRNLDYVVNNFEFIVSLAVLEELDKHKNDSGEIGFNCREAIRYIEDNDIEIDIDNNLSSYMIENGWDRNNDNLIIACALDRKLPLVTGDTAVCAKARSIGVNIIKTGTDLKRNSAYTGVRELFITSSIEDQKLYASIHENKYDNVLDMETNEYVIIKDEVTGKKEIKRWTGTELVNISVPGGKKGKTSIVGRNDHQLCAIDLLNNKDIPIKILAGTYGSGKTLLSIRMGLYHVKQSGQYSKIMVIRNNVGAGEAIGFLPGTKDEKINDLFRPISQNLEHGEIEFRDMMARGEISVDVPWYMKGTSLHDTYLLVDEAEDLDLKTIKLLGTRLAENSCVVFSGDWKQAERQFQRDNGLVQIIEKLKGDPLVGVVVLKEDVRSAASRVFAQMET